jgi:hypothetical protein
MSDSGLRALRFALVSRVWLILLLDACERTGTAPLSVSRLHRLVYLANTLTPVYNLFVPDGYVLKYRRGPFFPAVHWDVGRLVAQGLVFAKNAHPIKMNWAIGYPQIMDCRAAAWMPRTK